MKKTGRNLLVIALLVAVSAGVSYFTVNSLSKKLLQEVAKEQVDEYRETSARLVKAEPVPAIATDFTEAAEQSVHAVVHIMSKTTRTASLNYGNTPMDMLEYFFGYREYERRPQPQVGYGSGVIISRDGYIVTNNHVIENADEIEVTLNDRRSYPAKVIGADPTTDIALLKIEENDLATIAFGNSDQLKVGEWVLAVGNPMNLTSTVTAGIVSAKARNLGIIGSEQNNRNKTSNMSIESFIQTDAAVNPGNSGGALVNTKGELVGINTAIVSSSGAFSGYSFAVPINMVSKVVTDLKEYGTVQRAMLGVSIINMSSALAKDKKVDMREGVYVESVSEKSGAMEAGIKSGDIIVQIDDAKVKTTAELQEQVGRHRPGDKVNVRLVRDGKELFFEVTLRNMQGNTDVVKASDTSVLGAAFSELPANLKRQLNISYGIQVSGLTDGKMKEAGIRKGFVILKVNDHKIQSVNDFENLVKDVQQGAGFGEAALFIVGIYPAGNKVTYYAINMAE